ncbi:metal ABC transporter substrate-binding protein [Ornithinimicrobium cavernae]|uniref:metal ABC transporter substrate-binding protein n=1 Tax=Ornithinimicrobium cavernae TaxID=2666047 RepID=UPI000D6913FA|nr:metal ABC transporter substrate-binding protein [Ornithinimicrobium cavernae]
MNRRPLALAAAATAATLLTACGSGDNPAEGGDVRVVTAFYPLEFAAQQVAGDVSGVSIETLTAPGVEPHDLELTPRQVGAVSEADLVIYSSGMQAAVDEAVGAQAADHSLDTTTVVDLAETGDEDEHTDGEAHTADEHEDEHTDGEAHTADEHQGEEHADEEHVDEEHADEGGHDGHDHGSLDPHFWLDPERYAAAANAIAEELSALDPDNAETYRANAAQFADELTALDTEFAETLAGCEQDTLVTTHEAFGYLADRYGLHQVGITGITPDAEATPARVAEISRTVDELGVGAIYAESTLGGDLADVIGAETGAEVLVLDPIEGITDNSAGSDYFEVMRANLESLRQGQGCA